MLALAILIIIAYSASFIFVFSLVYIVLNGTITCVKSTVQKDRGRKFFID